MRPVRLDIQGFTCYREKQVVDFSRLSLFAIAGPTGAGKSSLLDAITFALYGKVPRLGGQNLDEFISLGAARASVVFDFDMQGERFRVVRSMPRNGTKKAQLEEISNGTQRALGDGVIDVNARLEKLLGLDYDAFVQSVLLPQGDFAKFLKSKPAEQRQILRDLLRLGIYERMRERAASETRELASAIERDRGMLEGPYAGATREHVILAEQELKGLEQRKEAAAAERDALRRCLERLQAQWKVVQEREERRAFLRRLDQDLPRIDQVRKAVVRAKLAAAVVPALQHAEEKANAWLEVQKQASQLEQQFEKVREVLHAREQTLRDAESRTANIPDKRARLLRLTAIRPILAERKTLLARCKADGAELAKAERAIADTTAELERARKSIVQTTEERDQLSKQRLDIGYDTSIHTTLKSARRLAFELEAVRKEAASIDLEGARTSVQRAETAVQAAERDFTKSRTEHSEAEEALKAAQSSLTLVQDKQRAAVLRSGLVAGCACPVCEQPVSNIPVSAPPADLRKAQSAVTLAEKNRTAVAERLEQARLATSRAQMNAENARARFAEMEKTAASCGKRIKESTGLLAGAIRPLECPTGILLEQFVEQEMGRYEKLHTQFEALGVKLSDAELALQRANSARDGAVRKLESSEENKVRLTDAIAEAERRLKDCEAEISSVASSDPERELKAVQEEIADLEKQHRVAESNFRDADAAARKLELQTAEARARLISAASEREQSRATADKGLHDSGFAEPQEAYKARMDPQAIAAGESEIEAADRSAAQTKARIAELDAQLEGVAIAESDVNREAEKAKAAEEQVAALERAIGDQSGQLQRLRADAEKADALRVEYDKRRSRHALMYQLSQDLRSDCFQHYLLEGSFTRLVSGASTRLRGLNERYELAFAEGRFAVIDHDHGSQIRLADTLSGGETFLVSLALALELSEEVQQAAGAVRLDSLFIDEGFGTLDPETLETVADAIESLGKTNRMVGVITHVPELHRRLPRLEVRPGASGSVVQYVEE